MLIIEKERDIEILKSLGADNDLIRKIFIFEGWLISIIGAAAGLILGFSICWLQQTFGLVRLQSTSLIMEAYPVIMKLKGSVSIVDDPIIPFENQEPQSKVVLEQNIIQTLVALFLSGVSIEDLSKQYDYTEELIKFHLEDKGIIIFDEFLIKTDFQALFTLFSNCVLTSTDFFVFFHDLNLAMPLSIN